jgi:hypothetical protein
MPSAINEVCDAALSLEPEQRARLAALLIESLEEVEAVDESEIERLWLAEAEERCRQIDAGEVQLIPANEVLESLRKRSR